MPSQASRQAPGDPGRQKMKVAPATPRGGAALDRRGADLGVAQHVEGDRETVHPLFEQRLDRLRRHVAAGKTGAAGGDDDIDAGIGDPSLDDDADRVDVVDDDLARREVMAGRGEPVRQRGSGLVVRQRTRVRDRQHRDVERHEGFGLVDGGHGTPLSAVQRRTSSQAVCAAESDCVHGASRKRRRNLNQFPPNVLQACTVPC